MTSCPDSVQLRGLLDGSLPQGEQDELTRHLDSCPSCQQAIEKLASGPSSWVDVAQRLKEQAQATTFSPPLIEPPGVGLGGETRADGDRAAGTSLAELTHLGNYELLGRLGQGGMGTVFKAFDPSLRRHVAIKVLAPELATSATARQRFLREARSAAAVRHPHVVAIHAVDEADGLPYLVMQLVDGPSLQQKIDQVGPLPVRDVVRIGLEMAEGLAAAHERGVIHRDIKPGNILLAGDEEQVKITDFGLARAADDASLTQSGVITGTPMYMSPEQARGDCIDHRTDLFSMGSVLYALCTGRPPFRAGGTFNILIRVSDEMARPIRELIPEVPAWLEAIIARLHAKAPGERFQSAREVAELLRQGLAHLDDPERVPAPVLGRGDRKAKRQRRGKAGRARRWAVVGLGVLLLAVGGLGLLEGTGRTSWTGLFRPAAVEGPQDDERDSEAGWVALFNGKDLSGWRAIGCRKEDWGVDAAREVLFARRNSGQKDGGWLMTEKEYRDFELRLEFKVSPGSNSGVALRSPLRGDPAYTGMEVQVLDDDSARKIEPWQRTGSIYGVVPSREQPTKPVGQWNSYHIVCKGRHVTVELNGERIVDANLGEHVGKAPDRRGHPGILRDGGHIGLQTHTGRVEFRKIVIRELEQKKPGAEESPGFQPLFNGEDLAGWRTHPGQPGHWEARDGVLEGRGPTSHLYTERDDFANFHLRLEANVAAGDESGVCFRCAFGAGADSAGPNCPEGYRVHLCSGPDDLLQTGSLVGLVPVTKRLVEPGQWFTLEVIARDERLVTKVNGTTVADFTDRAGTYRRGRLALQKIGRGTVVRFRNIEVRELPGGVPRPTSQPTRRLLHRGGGDVAREDGQRIEGTGKAMPIFELDKPDLPPGKIVCRARFKAEKALRSALFGIAIRYPGIEELTRLETVKLETSWVDHEVTFTLSPVGPRPELLRLEVQAPVKASLFVKDVEVLHVPAAFDEQQAEVAATWPPPVAVERGGSFLAHSPSLAALVVLGAEELATGGADGTVRLHRRDRQGWRSTAVLPGPGGWLTALAAAPGGRWLAAGFKDGHVLAWRRDAGGWREVLRQRAFTQPVGALAWSPDSGTLAAGERGPRLGDRLVRVWHLATGKLPGAFVEEKSTGVMGLIFSRDGRKLGIAWRSKLEWWDVQTNERVGTISGGAFPSLWDFRYEPDGTALAVTLAQAGRGLAVWAETAPDRWPNVPRRSFPGHTANIRCLAFGADGKIVASGSDDGTVKLWETASGAELATLRGHPGRLRALAFGKDGRTLYTAGVEGSVKAWHITLTDKGPFVLLARAGRKEQRLASLGAAVAAARHGDTIEVRGNGPFVSGAITIRGKALTIRAGAGYWPVIELDPRTTSGAGWLLSSDSPLVLEGLELHRKLEKGPPGIRALVCCAEAHLLIASCRLVVRGEPSNLLGQACPLLELRNTMLVCDNGPGIGAYLPSRGRIVVENCILSGTAVKYNARSGTFRGNSLVLRRSTAVAPSLVALSIDDALPPAGPEVRGLRVTTSGCILDAAAQLLAFQTSQADPPSPQQAEEWLKKLVSWSDQGSLYPPGPLLSVRGRDRAITLPGEPTGPEQWRGFWKMAEAKVLAGTPRYAGGDLRALQRTNFEAVVADDFRLLADGPGQGLGAEVGLVGPGPGYERWKKSKDYQAWRQQADEVLARPIVARPEPPGIIDYPFVILARDDRPERRLRTLAAAIRAVRDGDVIEVRGDGPFPCAPLRIPGPLTIRAGAGHRPVIHRASSLPGPLLSTASPLVLEGLTLEDLSQGNETREHGGLVSSNRAALYLANCRLVSNAPVKRSTHAVVARGSPRVEVRNCRFSVPNWAALAWLPLQEGRLVLEGNLFQPGRVLVHLNPAVLAALECDVVHNTWSTPTIGLEWRTASPARAKAAGAVRVRAEGNVLVATSGAFFFNQDQKAPVAAADSEAQARHLLKWELRRNLYEEGRPLFTFGQQWKPQPGARLLRGLGEWKEFWGQAQSDAVQAKVVLQDDFRLKPGTPGAKAAADGKDLGADLALVGPGPGYERWKKTKAYQQWLKQTAQGK